MTKTLDEHTANVMREVGARAEARGATIFVNISPADCAKMALYIRQKGGRMFDAGEPRYIRAYNNSNTPHETYDAITVFHTRGVPFSDTPRPDDPRLVYEYSLWTAEGGCCTHDTLNSPPPGGWGGPLWDKTGRRVKFGELPKPVREGVIFDYCFNHFAPEGVTWDQWEGNGIGAQIVAVFKREMAKAKDRADNNNKN